MPTMIYGSGSNADTFYRVATTFFEGKLRLISGYFQSSERLFDIVETHPL